MLDKISKFSELYERNLNFQDLNTEYLGRKKGDLFLDKIRNREPIIIKTPDNSQEQTKLITGIKSSQSGRIIPVEDIGMWDREKMKEIFLKPSGYRLYSPSLISDDGQIYKLNDIVKTQDYGTLTGSSLGSQSTDEVESVIIFFLSLRQKFKSDITDFDDDQLNSYLDNEDIKSSFLSKVPVTLELINKYPGWRSSFLNIPNAIYDRRNYILKENKGQGLKEEIDYVFHHSSCKDSDLITTIKSKYRELQTGVNINKWIPCDVWAVTNISSIKQQIIGRILNSQDLIDLREVLDSYFNSGDLVGISLKKISPKKEIQIIINQETSRPPVSFDRIILDRQNPFSSQGTTFVVNMEENNILQKRKWVFRSFSSRISDGQGEILGSDSRFGKISLKNISRILEYLNLSGPVPDVSFMQSFVTPDGEFIKRKITEITEEIFKISGKLIVPRVEDKPSRSTEPVSIKRLLSKWQGLYIAKVFIENISNNYKKVDKANEMIMYYALSIDISLDPFSLQDNTPKYIRII